MNIPAKPITGQIWLDADGNLKIFDGVEWIYPRASEDEILDDLFLTLSQATIHVELDEFPDFKPLFDSVFLASDRIFGGDE